MTRNGEGRGMVGKRWGGFSLVEVVVAVGIFSFAIMAMATSSGLVSKQMRVAQRDVRLAFAMQETMEGLLARGWAGLEPGRYGDTVHGFPMTWTVSGANPRTIVLIAQYEVESGSAAARSLRADTLVTHVAMP